MAEHDEDVGAQPEPDPAPPAGGTFSIDLDRERATRREGHGDNIEVTNHGVRFLLPVELPVDAVEPLAGLAELDVPEDADEGPEVLGQVRQALEGGLCVLFCDELEPPLDEADRTLVAVNHHSRECGWRRFRAQRPSMDDELALWRGLFAAYGTSLGEALASLDSSESDGAPSAATSSGSTASTAGKHGPDSVPAQPGRRAVKRAAARKRAPKAKAAAAAGSPG